MQPLSPSTVGLNVGAGVENHISPNHNIPTYKYINNTNNINKFIDQVKYFFSFGIIASNKLDPSTQQRIDLTRKIIIATISIIVLSAGLICPPLIAGIPIAYAAIIALKVVIYAIGYIGTDQGYRMLVVNQQNLLSLKDSGVKQTISNQPNIWQKICNRIFSTDKDTTLHSWLKIIIGITLIGGILVVSFLFPPIAFDTIGILYFMLQLTFTGIIGVIAFNTLIQIIKESGQKLWAKHQASINNNIEATNDQPTPTIQPETNKYKYAGYCFLYFFSKKYAPHLDSNRQKSINLWYNRIMYVINAIGMSALVILLPLINFAGVFSKITRLPIYGNNEITPQSTFIE